MIQVFPTQYGFLTGIAGLTYVGNGLGATVALVVCTRICDDAVKKAKVQSPDEQPAPEVRLPPMVYGSPLLTIGLLLYGWSAQYHVHWLVPIFGTAVFGAGIVAASLPTDVYMVDAFTEYTASGLAASFFLRSAAGGVLPLAGWPMLRALGVGWSSATLALIALVMCTAPPVVYKYGGFLRSRYPVEL